MSDQRRNFRERAHPKSWRNTIITLSALGAIYLGQEFYLNLKERQESERINFAIENCLEEEPISLDSRTIRKMRPDTSYYVPLRESPARDYTERIVR